MASENVVESGSFKMKIIDPEPPPNSNIRSKFAMFAPIISVIMFICTCVLILFFLISNSNGNSTKDSKFFTDMKNQFSTSKKNSSNSSLYDLIEKVNIMDKYITNEFSKLRKILSQQNNKIEETRILHNDLHGNVSLVIKEFTQEFYNFQKSWSQQNLSLSDAIEKMDAQIDEINISHNYMHWNLSQDIKNLTREFYKFRNTLSLQNTSMFDKIEESGNLSVGMKNQSETLYNITQTSKHLKEFLLTIRYFNFKYFQCSLELIKKLIQNSSILENFL